MRRYRTHYELGYRDSSRGSAEDEFPLADDFPLTPDRLEKEMPPCGILKQPRR